MSIRLKILLPIFAVALGGLLLLGAQMWVVAAESAATADVLDRALASAESARLARTAFRDIDALVAEVTAMTHFIDPNSIAQRFTKSSGVVAKSLSDLKARALSPETAAEASRALADFELWRRDAAVTLGVERAAQVPVADELARKRERVTSLLVRVTQVSDRDARAQTTGIAERQRFGLRLTVALALAFGAAASLIAWRVAANISRPIRALVAGAERLARGDVSVTFEATRRGDEIGDIARAVAAFRDNVASAQSAEAAAAEGRLAAENERRAGEAQRAASTKEQARVVDALSAGLERLAKGDLTARVEGDFGAAYARLKANFNTSLDVLQQALAAISEGARDLQQGSSDIAGLAADLSTRTGTQTASIEEAAAALEEITATVRATADHAGHARAVVTRTREEAEKSGAVVRTAVEAIGRIQQSSQQIEKIIGVIDEIAFQTNLLALNAGVEAARAGESGRGFAVVATEVRALAQRSANASKEIKTLISTSSAEVRQGVDLVVSAGAALDRIFAEVGEIDRVVGAIASGAAEQATGVQNVNRGVSEIDRVNQANVEIVERTTTACAGAAGRAEELAQAVAMFRLAPETAMRRAA